MLRLVRRRTARRRVRVLLTPEKGAKGVRGTRSWHAGIGTWALVGAFFLSATGLTWSTWENTAADGVEPTAEQITALDDLTPPAGDHHNEQQMRTIDR